MRHRMRWICGVGAIALGMTMQVARAGEAPPLPATTRCRDALREGHTSYWARGKPKPTFRDVTDGVELWEPAEGDRAARAFAHCSVRTMHLPEGTIDLPPDWIAVDGRGTDSHVGMILDGRGHERLRFDIGKMAGAYASTARRAEFTWLRDERIAGHTLRYGLRKNEVVITLAETTNFTGKVDGEKGVEALVGIVRTLHP